MLVMSPTSAAAAHRHLLVQRRDTVAGREPNGAKVRRYRLARLKVNGRVAGAGPHGHLKRMYD